MSGVLPWAATEPYPRPYRDNMSTLHNKNIVLILQRKLMKFSSLSKCETLLQDFASPGGERHGPASRFCPPPWATCHFYFCFIELCCAFSAPLKSVTSTSALLNCAAYLARLSRYSKISHCIIYALSCSMHGTRQPACERVNAGMKRWRLTGVEKQRSPLLDLEKPLCNDRYNLWYCTHLVGPDLLGYLCCATDSTQIQPSKTCYIWNLTMFLIS